MLNNRPDGEEYSNDSPSENAASEQANSLTFRRLNVLIVVLLSLLVGNQVWERIQEYRTQKAIEQWADQAEQALLEAQRELQSVHGQTQAQQAARQQQLRQTRAASSRGRWLAKNCADWRRANDELPTRTTAEEMQRHCAIYQNYLATGR